MSASGWHYGTIKELSEALTTRRISASELLELTIERIEALDSRINAVVVRDFERAREAARAADLALARGERRALLGIPFTAKEAINVAGLPTTWGFPEFKDFVSKEDAVVVTRAKNAGAILLGKTNVPLGLGDFQSYNDIYGTTNNPWNISRSPGAPQADQLRRLQRASGRYRSARILADRCACRRTSVAFTHTNRVLVWSRFVDTTVRRAHRCLPAAILR